MGIRFRKDTDEVSCDKSIRMTFEQGRVVCGCLRTKGHKGEHIAMAYDAAKADGICCWCRKRAGEMHRPDCTSGEYMVECTFCCARFGRAMNDVSYTQGADCASHIDGRGHDAVLFCGYGSAHDFETFKFVGEPVGFERADPVCDGCIRSFLEQGAMKKVRGEFTWGRR